MPASVGICGDDSGESEQLMSRRAFTLMELLMVVIIVGILAAMALPQFGKTTERSYQRQAQDMLRTIYAGERVFSSINNRFCNPTTSASFGGAGTTCDRTLLSGATWKFIYTDDPTTTTTTYAFSSADVFATTFTTTATRSGGSLCSAKTMTLDQNRTKAGTGWLTCPMPL